MGQIDPIDIAKAGIDPAEIRAIGLSTQRCTFTPVDEAGMSLRSAISWQDSRSFEECEEISRLVGAERYYEITGLPVGTTWSVSKIMWIKKHQPEIYAKTYKFAMDQERILNKLGAEGYFEDWSNGSLQGLMDIKAFEWSDELVGALEIQAARPGAIRQGRWENIQREQCAHRLCRGNPFGFGRWRPAMRRYWCRRCEKRNH